MNLGDYYTSIITQAYSACESSPHKAIHQTSHIGIVPQQPARDLATWQAVAACAAQDAQNVVLRL